MLKEDTEYKSTSEVENTKPQLRMVDLNLLTVFDAVMQEQNITRAAHSWHVAAGGQQCGITAESDV